MSQNIPQDPSAEPSNEPVATGDRRDEVTFEADPHQLVRASHLVRPDGPLPLQMQEPDVVAEDVVDPGVTDVRIAPEAPSVWDARPLPDRA